MGASPPSPGKRKSAGLRGGNGILKAEIVVHNEGLHISIVVESKTVRERLMPIRRMGEFTGSVFCRGQLAAPRCILRRIFGNFHP
jgi:hypothetical protein